MRITSKKFHEEILKQEILKQHTFTEWNKKLRTFKKKETHLFGNYFIVTTARVQFSLVTQYEFWSVIRQNWRKQSAIAIVGVFEKISLKFQQFRISLRDHLKIEIWLIERFTIPHNRRFFGIISLQNPAKIPQNPRRPVYILSLLSVVVRKLVLRK